MERELPAGANPWEVYDTLIAAVDYAKHPAIKNQNFHKRALSSPEVLRCSLRN